MNHSIIASSLVIGSIITIANASYVLMPYNCLNGLPKDAIYTEFMIYLVLASIGVVLGLYAMMYPDHFTNIKYLLPSLTYVWLIVTFVCTSRLFTAFNNLSNSVLLGQLIGSGIGTIAGSDAMSLLLMLSGAPSNIKQNEQKNVQLNEEQKIELENKLRTFVANPMFNKTGFIVQYVITSLLVVLTTLFTFVF
jgi:hypothetical protein